MESDLREFKSCLINTDMNSQDEIVDKLDAFDSISSNSEENPNNNMYYYRNIFSFKEIENIVNAQNFQSFRTDKAILEYIAEIEKIIMLKIKYIEDLSKFHKKILRDMSYGLLDIKIREYRYFKVLFKQINMIFNTFFDAFYEDKKFLGVVEDEESISKMLNVNVNEPYDVRVERSSSLSNFSNLKKFQKNSEKVSAVLNIIKNIYKNYLEVLIEKFKSHFQVQNFPFFLIRDAKCKIKRKINKKYIPKFKEIYLRNNFLNSLEYLIIIEKIKEISLKSLEIFDERILNLEIRETLIKIVFIILKSTYYHIKDEYFANSYHDIIQNIILALNVNLNNEEDNIYMIQSVNYCPTTFTPESNIKNENFYADDDKINTGTRNSNNPDIYQKSFTSNFKSELKIKRIIQVLEESTRNENLKELFHKLQISIDNKLETYLFIILSLSLLFNNFDLSSKTIVKTRAREKETLRKILLAFNENYQYDNFDVWKFNQILESVIFSHFFLKKYSTDLAVIKEKNFNKTMELVKNKITFDSINSLYKSEEINLNKQLRKNYDSLLENIPKKRKISRCENIYKFLQDFFLPYKEKQITVDLNLSCLVPYDKYNYSNHICIIVPGFISQYHNNHIQWENFIIDFDIYVDFYFYVWDSKTGIKIINDVMKFLGGLSLTLLTRNFLNVFGAYRTYQHKNNLFAKTTKISKYCGKFLAYVLASKYFLLKRTVTLVGFSLGGHVVKHCIKELKFISEFMPEIKDLIQNVVFIGAATCLPEKNIWTNINTIIGGRIINCYCNKDEVLQGIFKYITKKDALGIKPLVFRTSENNIVIENYDFTELEIKHSEYKCYLNEIIKKINLF